MTKARRGIYAAAVSPFNADGSLNAQKLLSYCQHLMSPAGGCDGVAPTGTTGEGTSISMPDRLALPGVFAEAGIETDRVIFGTGAPAAGDCVALTRAAVEAGYINVLVLPPYYYKNASDDGLFAYYANLVEKDWQRGFADIPLSLPANVDDPAVDRTCGTFAKGIRTHHCRPQGQQR